MGEKSLVSLNGKKKLSEAFMELEDTDNFLEIDLRVYADALTSAQAKELIREVAYWMLYKSTSDKGRPYTHIAAHKIISTEYRWLLDIANWKYTLTYTTKSHAERISQKVWEDGYEDRIKYAAIRFRDRMIQVDRLLPVVENAVLEGDLGAVDKFVALARLDMDASGYKAPVKYEFLADAAGELTEEDKQQGSEAVEYAKKFDEQVLDDIIDGEIVEESDEEE